jgi:hypothetical protein
MKNRTLARATTDATSRFPLRALLVTVVILLMPDHSFAQTSPEPTSMQCQLIRLAVAQYGYAAARRHALETYGPEAVKVGDRCFKGQERAKQ